jgi:hypothetical protein
VIAATARPSLRQALGSLSEPAFRRWFLSQALSASGTMTQGVGQAWLVLKLTGSGVDLGLMTACFFVPLLVGGPWAGAAFELVGSERVASAVSLNEVVLNTSRVLGPAAGGALLATLGVAACFELNAISYLPPLVVLIFLPGTTHAVRTAAPTANQAGELPGRLRGGLAYAWQNRTIRACLLLAAASGMLFNLNVPLPLLASRTFHLGGGGYGLLMTVFGLGALPGAVLAASGRGKPRGRSVAALALVTALCVLATGSAPDAILAVAGMAATGCFSIWFIACANTLVQLETDSAMRGRVMGVWSMALPGCEPITAPFVGWVAGSIGAREGFGLAGVALVLALASGWPALRRDRNPAAVR